MMEVEESEGVIIQLFLTRVFLITHKAQPLFQVMLTLSTISNILAIGCQDKGVLKIIEIAPLAFAHFKHDPATEFFLFFSWFIKQSTLNSGVHADSVAICYEPI